ncbi:MAG TPA: AMP-binding protein [Gammaproteobacteria bacterium]|nr:AMP-binding protein [Gammaproteobacteria bacterium]
MAPTLLHGFLEQAFRQPQAPAFACGTGRVSYGDLSRQVRGVAEHLRANGLAPGSRVAMLLPNGPAYAAVLYGIWMAGGVAVPMDPSARTGSVRGRLRHAGATWVFAASPVIGIDAGVRVVTLGAPDTPTPWTAAQAPGDQSIPVRWGHTGRLPRSDALAVISYTSGTTGRPKGVMLSHANLASNARAIAAYLDLGPGERALATLPFHYAYGASVLNSHLAAGGCLVVGETLVYPERLLARIQRERVTGLPGVPSTFALLAPHLRDTSHDLRCLRYATQAGGPMAPELVRAVSRRLPWLRFFVMYGQTEATARLSYLPPHRFADKPGSAGVPVADTVLEVRDRAGGRLPAGRVGEIWARGPGIMRGYWRDPEASADVLRDGWLRTGDLGWMDAEGFLYLRGRRSQLIKVGAQRVSPEEVEEVLARLPYVAEAAVIGIADKVLGQVVGAVIVPRPGAAVEPREVQRHCLEHLARHKVPRYVRVAAALPRTASGKLRRHVLARGIEQAGPAVKSQQGRAL